MPRHHQTPVGIPLEIKVILPDEDFVPAIYTIRGETGDGRLASRVRALVLAEVERG